MMSDTMQGVSAEFDHLLEMRPHVRCVEQSVAGEVLRARLVASPEQARAFEERLVQFMAYRTGHRVERGPDGTFRFETWSGRGLRFVVELTWL
jgi:hypothetical protein